MRVEEIWRFPVKSLGGERLERADVTEIGIRGDRAWGVLDPATGLVLTARREPSLLFLRSEHRDTGRPAIFADCGTELADDAALSSWLGRPVRVVAASDGPGTFENPMNVDDETDWVRWQSAGETFHDGRSTISFVSRGSLAEWDARRFRINLILDGHGEESLTGEVAAGSARLQVRTPIDRCVMVTRAQPDLPRDLTVLRRIVAERANQLGVGAIVTSPGTVAVGDELGEAASPTGR